MLIESLLVIAASAHPIPSAAAGPTVDTYDAIVPTEETPPVKDLTKPAVLIEDRDNSLIVSAPNSRSIA
jgi:hypothetical protein